MIGLSDIFPVRTIYLGSGFAVLIWVLPYAFGTTIHHFTAGRWARGVGWILFILFIPSFVLARVFAWGLENDLYTPRTVLMSISCLVMAGQAVLWWLLWTEYRKRGEPAGWRTTANWAFIASLILLLMSLGSFYLEKRYRYLEGTRRRQQAMADAQHLEKAGYLPYPNAHYRFGECMIRESYEDVTLAGYLEDRPGAYRQALDINFQTDDDPSKVLDFYSDRARKAGMTVRRGTSRTSGAPVIVGVGAERRAMVIELLPLRADPSVGDWSATIYWDTPKGFEESLDLNFELEGM